MHRLNQITSTSYRVRLVFVLLMAALIALTAFTSVKATAAVPMPKVIIFDVNETLLDLAPLRISVGQALQGREDLLSLWFSTMLHYSLVETLTGDYHDFGQIGVAALMMVAQNQASNLTLKWHGWLLLALSPNCPPTRMSSRV